MGRIYIRGLWRGVVLSCSKEARKKKFPYHGKYFGAYAVVQFELWYNMLRRVTEG